MFILGSIDQGITIVKKVNNLVQKTNLTTDSTWHLTKNTKGFLVSSDSEKINLFDENLNLIKSFSTHTQGYKYAVLSDDGLYFGTNAGLFLQKDDSSRLISKNIISSLSINENSLTIAAGTPDGKVLIIKNGEITNSIDTKKNEPIFDVELTSDNLIYIAGQDGLKKYENGLLENLNNEITYSIEKSDNGIYFGTSTSLMLYNDTSKKISRILSNNKEIYAIVDNDGFITASSLSRG